MNNIRFVKSFSRGQITIPKDIRDSLGMTEDFWLKLIISDGKIIAEPITDKQKINKEEYLNTLLNIKGSWDLSKEIKQNREEVEKRLKKNAL